jgi:hypothetical protein
MDINPETIRDYLPYYLTEQDKVGIANELKNFHLDKMQYYLISEFQQEMLQGDGWKRLALRNFTTGEKISINGVILSNTCDIASENPRELPVNIVFAPLVALDNFIKRLKTAGVGDANVANKVQAIRRQRVTGLFYLPRGSGLDAEHIVILDDIHSMPAVVYREELATGKLFTLSQAGFYLFILKLSIHFCRFHENVRRIAS